MKTHINGVQAMQALLDGKTIQFATTQRVRLFDGRLQAWDYGTKDWRSDDHTMFPSGLYEFILGIYQVIEKEETSA